MPVAIEVKSQSSVLAALGEYSGKTLRLVPAPNISFGKQYQTTSAGIPVGSSLSITLTGYLIATQGSPTPAGYNGGVATATFDNAGWAATVDDNDDYVARLTDAGSEDRLAILLAKSEALRTLFTGNILSGGDLSNPYDRGPIKLIVEPLNGGQASEFLCQVEGDIQISDASGFWYNYVEYTINLICHSWSHSDNDLLMETEDQWKYKISSLDENWSITETEPTYYHESDIANTRKTWEITHTVSAVGKREFVDNGTDLSVIEAFDNATGILYDNNSKLLAYKTLTPLGGGLYTLPAGFSFGQIGSVGASINPYGGSLDQEYAIGFRAFSETRSKTDGSVSVTETMIFAPRNAISVGATENVSLSVESDNQSSITRYNLNGTVQGFSTLDPTSRESNAWDNSKRYYDTYVAPKLLQRISYTYSKLNPNDNAIFNTLNPIPLSKSVSYSPVGAEVNYSASYDTRRRNITNALSEDIQVSDSLVGYNYSETPIIGRQAGPIIQYLKSNTGRSRTLNISLVVSGVPNSAEPLRNLLLRKPSINPDFMGFLGNVYDAFDPVKTGEASKAVFDQPVENWSPITGNYDYSVTWKWQSPKTIVGIK
jgi:hypothetical protein